MGNVCDRSSALMLKVLPFTVFYRALKGRPFSTRPPTSALLLVIVLITETTTCASIVKLMVVENRNTKLRQAKQQQ